MLVNSECGFLVDHLNCRSRIDHQLYYRFSLQDSNTFINVYLIAGENSIVSSLDLSEIGITLESVVDVTTYIEGCDNEDFLYSLIIVSTNLQGKYVVWKWKLDSDQVIQIGVIQPHKSSQIIWNGFANVTFGSTIFRYFLLISAAGHVDIWTWNESTLQLEFNSVIDLNITSPLVSVKMERNGLTEFVCITKTNESMNGYYLSFENDEIIASKILLSTSLTGPLMNIDTVFSEENNAIFVLAATPTNASLVQIPKSGEDSMELCCIQFPSGSPLKIGLWATEFVSLGILIAIAFDNRVLRLWSVVLSETDFSVSCSQLASDENLPLGLVDWKLNSRLDIFVLSCSLLEGSFVSVSSCISDLINWPSMVLSDPDHENQYNPLKDFEFSFWFDIMQMQDNLNLNLPLIAREFSGIRRILRKIDPILAAKYPFKSWAELNGLVEEIVKRPFQMESLLALLYLLIDTVSVTANVSITAMPTRIVSFAKNFHLSSDQVAGVAASWFLDRGLSQSSVGWVCSFKDEEVLDLSFERNEQIVIEEICGRPNLNENSNFVDVKDSVDRPSFTLETTNASLSKSPSMHFWWYFWRGRLYDALEEAITSKWYRCEFGNLFTLALKKLLPNAPLLAKDSCSDVFSRRSVGRDVLMTPPLLASTPRSSPSISTDLNDHDERRRKSFSPFSITKSLSPVSSVTLSSSPLHLRRQSPKKKQMSRNFDSLDLCTSPLSVATPRHHPASKPSRLANVVEILEGSKSAMVSSMASSLDNIAILSNDYSPNAQDSSNISLALHNDPEKTPQRRKSISRSITTITNFDNFETDFEKNDPKGSTPTIRDTPPMVIARNKRKKRKSRVPLNTNRTSSINVTPFKSGKSPKQNGQEDMERTPVKRPYSKRTSPTREEEILPTTPENAIKPGKVRKSPRIHKPILSEKIVTQQEAATTSAIRKLDSSDILKPSKSRKRHKKSKSKWKAESSKNDDIFYEMSETAKDVMESSNERPSNNLESSTPKKTSRSSPIKQNTPQKRIIDVQEVRHSPRIEDLQNRRYKLSK